MSLDSSGAQVQFSVVCRICACRIGNESPHTEKLVTSDYRSLEGDRKRQQK